MSSLSPTIRPTTREEAPRVAALIASVQPQNAKADLAVMMWQYWDNPYGDVSSWVAENEDGQLLGHFMNFPIEGLVAGQRVPLGKGGDMVTVPEARGQGIASKLTAAAYGHLGERGYDNTFATPNGMSRGAATRGGMDFLGQLPLWLRPLDAEWAADQSPVKLGAAGPALAGLGLKVAFRTRATSNADVLSSAPDDTDVLWAEACTLEPDTSRIVHDRTWWDWRYARPNTQYVLTATRRNGRLTALVASCVREAFDAQVLHVVDILASAPADAADAVETAIGACADNVVAVAGVALPNTLNARALKAAGMRRVPERLHPKPSFMGFTRNTSSAKDITDHPWCITWSDFDHI